MTHIQILEKDLRSMWWKRRELSTNTCSHVSICTRAIPATGRCLTLKESSFLHFLPHRQRTSGSPAKCLRTSFEVIFIVKSLPGEIAFLLRDAQVPSGEHGGRPNILMPFASINEVARPFSDCQYFGRSYVDRVERRNFF